MEFLKALPTAAFAEQPLPLWLFCAHAVAMAHTMRDGCSGGGRRTPLASLLLLLFALLSGGAVVSALLGTRPGWLAGDRALAGYVLAWLAMRCDALHALLAPRVAPALLLVHSALFRPFVLVATATAAARLLPGSVLGPVVCVVLTMHGCNWLARLAVLAADGPSAAQAATKAFGDDFAGKPSHGLRTTFWLSLAYSAVLVYGGDALAALHVGIAVACTADFVLHDLLGTDVSTFPPLDAALAFVVSAPATFSAKLPLPSKMKKKAN